MSFCLFVPAGQLLHDSGRKQNSLDPGHGNAWACGDITQESKQKSKKGKETNRVKSGKGHPKTHDTKHTNKT